MFGRPTPPSAACPSLQEIQGPQGRLTPLIVKTPPDISRGLKNLTMGSLRACLLWAISKA